MESPFDATEAPTCDKLTAMSLSPSLLSPGVGELVKATISSWMTKSRGEVDNAGSLCWHGKEEKWVVPSSKTSLLSLSTCSPVPHSCMYVHKQWAVDCYQNLVKNKHR